MSLTNMTRTSSPADMAVFRNRLTDLGVIPFDARLDGIYTPSPSSGTESDICTVLVYGKTGKTAILQVDFTYDLAAHCFTRSDSPTVSVICKNGLFKRFSTRLDEQRAKSNLCNRVLTSVASALTDEIRCHPSPTIEDICGTVLTVLTAYELFLNNLYDWDKICYDTLMGAVNDIRQGFCVYYNSKAAHC